MWGTYHTRWWLTQKIVVSICGLGVFGYSNTTKIWYYRLLGAKIGKNVELNTSTLKGEWDLVEIGDGVILADKVHIRPFAVEKGCTMYLSKITIGNHATVGLGSTLAPGTTVPEDPSATIPENMDDPSFDEWETSHKWREGLLPPAPITLVEEYVYSYDPMDFAGYAFCALSSLEQFEVHMSWSVHPREGKRNVAVKRDGSVVVRTPITTRYFTDDDVL